MNGRTTARSSKRLSLLLGMAAFAAITSHASAQQVDVAGVKRAIDLAFRRDCPLAALAEIERSDASDSLRMRAQIAALVGGEISGSSSAGQGKKTAPRCASEEPWTTERPAIPELMHAITNRNPRIVIINESHTQQAHRAFTLLLVRSLATHGFTILAGEAFSKEIARTMEDGIPSPDSGTYTADPVYAELLRYATHKGFDILPYDFDDPDTAQHSATTLADQENARSARQASRIMERLSAEPQAKAILVVGSGHGSRTPENGVRRVAARLADDFGVEVFSIDQVWGTPLGGLYRFGNRCVTGNSVQSSQPVILTKDGEPLTRAGFDVTVFHPTTRPELRRPDWILSLPGRHLVEIPIVGLDARSLVRAYRVADPEDSLAYDQVIVQSNDRSAPLALEDGTYRIVLESESCARTAIYPSFTVSQGKILEEP